MTQWFKQIWTILLILNGCTYYSCTYYSRYVLVSCKNNNQLSLTRRFKQIMKYEQLYWSLMVVRFKQIWTTLLVLNGCTHCSNSRNMLVSTIMHKNNQLSFTQRFRQIWTTLLILNGCTYCSSSRDVLVSLLVSRSVPFSCLDQV